MLIYDNSTTKLKYLFKSIYNLHVALITTGEDALVKLFDVALTRKSYKVPASKLDTVILVLDESKPTFE